MKGQFLVAAAMLTTTAASGSDLLVFHTSYFKDSVSVDLSLMGSRPSTDTSYDFDVLIGLAESTADSSLHYRDSVAHRARVRCSQPPAVFVGGIRYQVNLWRSVNDADAWKADLWKAVCGVPVS